ncbi:hypothetical protein D1646_11405 [Pseudoflavonifractor sp. 60]|uniref:hypothetical protein n=1 Tax=Pseudoflavonifractor sp. 60 TaxID=2304576 RepID=UPI00136C755F|nr:hypothetical protein [Pseudoflavonifractor sp. 60]NBI67405.1 hypothetical protein [Pseudoflavonifractor sp. 60]
MEELLRLLRTEYGLRCDHWAVYAALDKLRAVGCLIPEYQDDGEGYRLLSRSLELSKDLSAVFLQIHKRLCQLFEVENLAHHSKMSISKLGLDCAAAFALGATAHCHPVPLLTSKTCPTT